MNFLQAGRPEAASDNRRRQMKIMSVIAVVVAVLGTANFALAQANPDLEVNTGSPANAQADTHQGEYKSGN
jgi:hypothetical protein